MSTPLTRYYGSPLNRFDPDFKKGQTGFRGKSVSFIPVTLPRFHDNA